MRVGGTSRRAFLRRLCGRQEQTNSNKGRPLPAEETKTTIPKQTNTPTASLSQNKPTSSTSPPNPPTNSEAPTKSSNYEAGKRIRERLIRVFAVTTDKSGEALKRLTEEEKKQLEEWEKEWKGREQEYLEKYGGYPSTIQLIIEKLDETDRKPPATRRCFLFGSAENPERGPKGMVKDSANVVGKSLIPWPVRIFLGLFGFK